MIAALGNFATTRIFPELMKAADTQEQAERNPGGAGAVIAAGFSKKVQAKVQDAIFDRTCPVAKLKSRKADSEKILTDLGVPGSDVDPQLEI